MDVDDMKDDEYTAQLFGFTLKDFMAAIKILVKEEVTRFTEAITISLMKKYNSDNPETEQVKMLAKSLIDQYVYASEEPLKTLEVQLKELLHIPRHVLLPGDNIQRTQYSVEEEQEVDRQIAELLARIKRTKFFDEELRQELKILRDALPLLNKQVKESERLLTECEESEKVFQTLEPSIDKMVDRLQLLNMHKNDL